MSRVSVMSTRDYSKLELQPLFGMEKIILKLGFVTFM